MKYTLQKENFKQDEVQEMCSKIIYDKLINIFLFLFKFTKK